ncbi:ATP-binding protein [Pseudomonas typographi]|uniref:ATP-binding protein n=1 Tax=Pseudomonas typographi TaxID=2715964 RepID=UPI001EEF3096|nr:ATP-binding protein [Pseudomonas typographi]
MEMIAPGTARALPVTEPAHVDAARRAVIRGAVAAGAGEPLLARLAVVAQEMAHNLVRHAGGGELYYQSDAAYLTLLAIDRGPGMANTAQCMGDHYSTIGTLGVGLGSIKRMSDQFDLYSLPGQGTVVLARFEMPAGVPAGLTYGALCTPYPGETVCGDAWVVHGERVLVCDGLGHGQHAQQASQRAREVFLGQGRHLPLETAMVQLHRALAATRGGAAAIAEVQAGAGQVLFCGVGNIAGMLYGEKSRGLVSCNGTVGYRVGRINTYSYPWDRHTLLIMTSDGINSRLDLSPYPGLRLKHPAVIAGVIHRDFRRLNDDATVIVART